MGETQLRPSPGAAEPGRPHHGNTIPENPGNPRSASFGPYIGDHGSKMGREKARGGGESGRRFGG